MTGNQLISQIEIGLNLNSDDSIFSRRYILDLIEQTREVDLRNEYNRLRSIHNSIKQTICVPMELVDSATCCSEILSGCLVLKSINPIPDTIELHQKDGIILIRPSTLLSKKITHITLDRAPYVGFDDLSKDMLFSFLYLDHLYIISKNIKNLLIDSVDLTAIFRTPSIAGNYACATKDCFTLDNDYPILGWMWESLTKPKVMQQLLGQQFMVKDENNNAKDDKNINPVQRSNRQQQQE